MTLLSRFLASPAIIVTIVGLAASARASGGLSSAYIQDQTDHSVNINWSDPPFPDYRYYCCSATLQVCYKVDGVNGSCENHGTTSNFTVNPQRMVTVTGLSPSTKYHFTVYAQTEKQGLSGNYKNRKLRKLGEVTATTNATYTPTEVEFLVLIGAGIGDFMPKVWTNHDWDYDLVRVGYKLLGSSYPLTTVCSARNGPSTTWVKRNSVRGWVDVHDPSSPVSPLVDSLKTCRKYLVVAYGFRTGSQTGEMFGSAWCKTAGSCDPAGANVMLIDDHGAVVEAYADALHHFYCDTPPPPPTAHTDRKGTPDMVPCSSLSIFDHVAAQHAELWDDYAAMIEDGDLPAGEFETIQYLEEMHPDIFDAWQSEPSLEAAGMDMLPFVKRNYPATYASVMRDELDKPVISEPVPTVYPNPFNPETTIRFTVRTRGTVSLSIYNVEGRLVRTLVGGILAEGPHNAVWDGRDNMDQPVPSGIYFYRLVTNHIEQTNKLLLLK